MSTEDDKVPTSVVTKETGDVATPAPVETTEEAQTEEEIMEALERELRNAEDEEISKLEEGPFKTFRTMGLPSMVYKMKGDTAVKVKLEDIISKSEEIAVYFSASWCGPCKEFSPKLIETYNKVNSEVYADENKGRKAEDVQAFEIILCPVDKDETDFKTYYQTMPWASLEFDGVSFFRMKLCETYNLESIPTLLMFDAKSAELLTGEGFDAVERNWKSLENYPWKGYSKPLYVRLLHAVASKAPLIAVAAVMMYRNYNATYTPTETVTTTTTAVIEAAKVILDEL